MQTSSFTTSILVECTPEQAFKAISNARGFKDCSSAWGHYINGALRKLIMERAS
jgi:hypothetical protein